MSKLPPQLELRKDQPIPCDENFQTQDFWQIYIDNFDEARSHRSSQENPPRIGQPSEWSLLLRETGEKLGIVFQDDPEKLKRQEIRTKTLGAESTSNSRIRPSMQRMIDFAGMVAATLSEPTPSLKTWRSPLEWASALCLFDVNSWQRMVTCGGFLLTNPLHVESEASWQGMISCKPLRLCLCV
jgi:hypothetical protein